MATQLDLAKEALAQIGTRSKITSLTDGSSEAQYISLLYGPIRDFLLAEGDYDFSLDRAGTVALAAPGAPWVFSYQYPASGLRIRQMIPSVFDALDPRPVTWNIAAFDGVKQIVTMEAMSSVVFTKAVAEALWDPLFSESFVRMLSSALAFALENRIEASKLKMEEALSFAGVANMRDE